MAPLSNITNKINKCEINKYSVFKNCLKISSEEVQIIVTNFFSEK